MYSRVCHCLVLHILCWLHCRNDPQYISSLGMTVLNVCRVVPHGVLVFFPSYTVLYKCKEKCQVSGPRLLLTRQICWYLLLVIVFSINVNSIMFKISCVQLSYTVQFYSISIVMLRAAGFMGCLSSCSFQKLNVFLFWHEKMDTGSFRQN